MFHQPGQGLKPLLAIGPGPFFQEDIDGLVKSFRYRFAVFLKKST
jgi:hypothetical protein